jgi:hypothetical protein
LICPSPDGNSYQIINMTTFGIGYLLCSWLLFIWSTNSLAFITGPNSLLL